MFKCFFPFQFNIDELQNFENDLKLTTAVGQDTDDEVVIESEEIREISLNKLVITAGDQSNASPNASGSQPHEESASKGGNEAQRCTSTGKGGNTCNSPRKRFTTLNDVIAGESVVLKRKMETQDGFTEVKKLLQRTGKVGKTLVSERK